jgi:ectoine hydroxylase-related dioxygenase (phytanoyl-CoA dioxygenase family)
MRPDEETIERLQRDGAVLLPGLLAGHVDALRVAVAENMASPSPFERTYRPDDGSAPFFQDFCNWSRIDGFRRAVENSAMAEAAAQLMRSTTARIFHDHVLVKEPGNSMKTPWHQDQPYYLVDGRQSVSFWVPLDPVPREIAVEYVAGSHASGHTFRPDRFDGTSLYSGDDSEPVPDVEGRRSALTILGWGMQPGDAVAFNFRTLHGAPANTTRNRRRAVSFRWVGDDARFARRKGRTSPPFLHLAFEDGAPFGGPDFPVLWPRTGRAQ